MTAMLTPASQPARHAGAGLLGVDFELLARAKALGNGLRASREDVDGAAGAGLPASREDVDGSPCGCGFLVQDMLRQLREISQGLAGHIEDRAAEIAEARAAAARRAAAERMGLTGRQVEVVKGLARGKTLRQIAKSLGIKEGTAGVHCHKASRRAGASSTAELVARAAAAGLVRLEDLGEQDGA